MRSGPHPLHSLLSNQDLAQSLHWQLLLSAWPGSRDRVSPMQDAITLACNTALPDEQELKEELVGDTQAGSVPSSVGSECLPNIVLAQSQAEEEQAIPAEQVLPSCSPVRMHCTAC